MEFTHKKVVCLFLLFCDASVSFKTLFSVTAQPIWIKLGTWLDTPFGGMNLKKSRELVSCIIQLKELSVCVHFPICRPFLSIHLANLDQTWHKGGYCQWLYESRKSGRSVKKYGFYIIKKSFGWVHCVFIHAKFFCHLFFCLIKRGLWIF